MTPPRQGLAKMKIKGRNDKSFLVIASWLPSLATL